MHHCKLGNKVFTALCHQTQN